MPATEADLNRATSADEAARARLHADQRAAITAKRTAALHALRGDPAAARACFERWAALLPSSGDEPAEPPR
jgi:hypothetical protein